MPILGDQVDPTLGLGEEVIRELNNKYIRNSNSLDPSQLIQQCLVELGDLG